MPKKIFSNVLLLLAANLLIKPFWILGIDRTVQNTVGNEAYGQYMVIFNMTLIFTMILDFGINNYTSSFIAKHRHLLSKKFATLFPLKLVFSALYLLLTFFLGLFYGIPKQQLLLLLLIAFNQVLVFFLTFFRANITGLQWFKTEAFLSVLDRTLMIAVAGSLLLLFKKDFTITQFILAQTVSYVGAALIAFIILLKPLQKFYISFDWKMMLVLIRKSWPYALLALLMTIYLRSDYLIMKKLLPDGDEQNGIYAVANHLMEAANMIAAIVAGIFLPLFSSMLKKKESVNAIVENSMLLLILPAVCVAAIAWYYNQDIMLLISKTSPIESAPVFKVVMISFASMCFMYIFGTLLTANGNLKTLNSLAAIAIGINLFFNFLLQPRYGALGAAIAMAFTQFFIAVSNTYYAFTKIKIGISYRFLVKFSLIICLSVLSVKLCSIYVHNFWIASFISAIVVLIAVFVTKLVQLSQLKILFSKSN